MWKQIPKIYYSILCLYICVWIYIRSIGNAQTRNWKSPPSWGNLTGIDTGWDLGPGTLCCSACTWTNVSSSNIIQRNYTGLKITACMGSWDKLGTTRYKKTKNPTATSEEPRAKAKYCAWALHTAPPRGWADHLTTPPARPLDPPLPSPHIRNQLSLPSPAESKQGKLLLVFTPLCCSTSPNKDLPEFLVWLLINFCWLRRPRSLVCNRITG